MDQQVETFLREVANTLGKLEAITYFHEHPFAMDNAEGMARWLNRQAEDLAAELVQLSEAGILSRSGSGDEAVYSYSPDENQCALIRKVVESYRVTREAVRAQVRLLEQKQEKLREEFQALLFTERGKTDTILNSLEEGVLVLGRDSTVLLANQRFMQRFAPEIGREVAGLSLEDLVGVGPAAEAVRRSLAALNSHQQTVDYVHHDYHYKVQSVPVTGPDGRVIADDQGKVFATVTVFRDTTREHEIERLREDFISMLTHDLKNPLGIILGSSTLILDGKIGEINQKQEKLLNNVVKSCGMMDRLIQDFLTLSRLEAGQLKMNLTTVDLNYLIKTILQLYNPQIRQKNLHLTYKADYDSARVLADSVYLERVVSNLVGNAVKYTDEGGKIRVSLGRDEKGGRVQVDVADTGMGIREEDLPYVFEKFRRAEGSEHTKGSGLGLAIAREVVTALGGEVWASSKKGEGSVFSFCLPRAGTG